MVVVVAVRSPLGKNPHFCRWRLLRNRNRSESTSGDRKAAGLPFFVRGRGSVEDVKPLWAVVWKLEEEEEEDGGLGSDVSTDRSSGRSS